MTCLERMVRLRMMVGRPYGMREKETFPAPVTRCNTRPPGLFFTDPEGVRSQNGKGEENGEEGTAA